MLAAPQVVIRRSIGVKKDEYFIDRKHVTKQEVTSMLETAGLSRSNPYNIVPQGRVSALTTMKDDAVHSPLAPTSRLFRSPSRLRLLPREAHVKQHHAASMATPQADGVKTFF